MTVAPCSNPIIQTPLRTAPQRRAVVAGALILAPALLLAWGAFHDGAFAEPAPAPAAARAVDAGAGVGAGSAGAALDQAWAELVVRLEQLPIRFDRTDPGVPAKIGPGVVPATPVAVVAASPAGPVALPGVSAAPTEPEIVVVPSIVALLSRSEGLAIAPPAGRVGGSPSSPAPALVSAPVSAATFAQPLPVTAAAGPAASQCNGTDNVGGQAVACEVTVTNNLDLGTGATSSTVVLKECHGAANAALPCTTTTTPSDQLTTSVDQCNGSGGGGGGTVTCDVLVVNNITGAALPTPATIDQCNGSGAGGGTQPTVSCDPLGNTTNATITQCNGSGNGGGATMRVQCAVHPSTQASAIPIDVDQCNGSGNGGGATVICSVQVTNNVFPPSDDSTPDESTPDDSTPDGSTGPVPPGPVQPGPVQPGPVSPGPVQLGPVTPGPVVPVPTLANPGAVTPIPGATPIPGLIIGLAPAIGGPGVMFPGGLLVSGGVQASPVAGADRSSSVDPDLAAGLPSNARFTDVVLARTGVDLGSLALLAGVALVLGALLLGVAARTEQAAR